MDDSINKTPEYSKSLSRELEEVINKQNLLTSRTRRRVLVDLQETSSKEEDEEMKKLRRKAIEEIINSEKSYLHQLEIVEEFFMRPIEEGEILPNNVFANMFGDILGIRQVNKELLQAMEVSTDKIGKVFLDLAPYLKFYSTYANDFQAACKLVEENLEKNKAFRALLAKQESRPEVQKKLNSLLITPVQRIPRYKLLLDDIIKNTPRFHPDLENLTEARCQIDAIAWHINDHIKEHENNRIMVDIQQSLQGGLPKIIKPGRKLVRQGNLMKVNKNGGHAQPRYLILFTDMLMYCKSRHTVELPMTNSIEVCCLLPLKHTTVEEVVGKGVFTVQCQKEHLVLYSANVADSDWVDTIRNAIRVLKKNKASLRRESSTFEPMRKQDMLKLRRESLGKIMMMRKAEAAIAEQKGKEAGRSPKSPGLFGISLNITPKKRGIRSGGKGGSPFKLKRLTEEASSPTDIQPISEECEEEAHKEDKKESKSIDAAETSIKKEKEEGIVEENEEEQVILRKPKNKQEFKRKTTRSSLRSLTLGRTFKPLKKEKSRSTVFRSPSIYDEPKPLLIAVEEEEDVMTSYLSGKICPLTPSTKPCNVDHLAKQEEGQDDQKENTSIDTEEVDEEPKHITPYPIEIHDGILNQKRSFCAVS